MATDMREEQRASVLSRATEAVTRSFTERDKGIKISDASAETGIHIGSIYNIFGDKGHSVRDRDPPLCPYARTLR